MAEGLAALEEMARPKAGAFLFGDTPTIADVCLVPQLYNARRFSVPLTDYPTLRRADETPAPMRPSPPPTLTDRSIEMNRVETINRGCRTSRRSPRSKSRA